MRLGDMEITGIKITKQIMPPRLSLQDKIERWSSSNGRMIMCDETYYSLLNIAICHSQELYCDGDVSKEPQVALLIDNVTQSVSVGVAQYNHWCAQCLFIGNCQIDDQRYDLYVCQSHETFRYKPFQQKMLVARKSSKCGDCVSELYYKLACDIDDNKSKNKYRSEQLLEAVSLWPFEIAYKLSLLTRFVG